MSEWYDSQKKPSGKSNPLIWMCILNLPIMYLDGLISELTGFERLQTLYFFTLLIFAFVYMFHTNISIKWWLFLPFFGISFSVILSSFNINNFGGVTSNLQYFLRGPLLFTVLLIIFRNKLMSKHVRLFCIATISTCTMSTIVHAFFSIGFANKGLRLNPIFNGYLSDTNSAVFLLLLTALLYFKMLTGVLKKSLLVAILLFNVAALDSKAGILLIFLFLTIKTYLIMFGNTSSTRLILYSLISAFFVAIIQFSDKIAYFILNLVFSISVKSSSSLDFKFNNFDIFTIITATRNLKYLALSDIYPPLENFMIFLFGNSFWIYKDNKLVESDLLDSLLALGFVGCLSIYFLYFWSMYIRSKNIDREFTIALFILVLCLTVLVGHVFYSPASVIGLSLTLSYISRTKDRNLI
jgi:hypothetical protein